MLMYQGYYKLTSDFQSNKHNRPDELFLLESIAHLLRQAQYQE